MGAGDDDSVISCEYDLPHNTLRKPPSEADAITCIFGPTWRQAMIMPAMERPLSMQGSGACKDITVLCNNDSPVTDLLGFSAISLDAPLPILCPLDLDLHGPQSISNLSTHYHPAMHQSPEASSVPGCIHIVDQIEPYMQTNSSKSVHPRCRS